MQTLEKIILNYTQQLYIPSVGWTDAVEILIITFVIYHVIRWIRNTRAYALVKGLLVIVLVVIGAALFNMTTILYIVENFMSTAMIALVIILQPELRGAMEELGQRNFLSAFVRGSRRNESGRYSDATIDAVVAACASLSQAKIGALIVLRQDTPLREYERTGIAVDGIVSSQLLINTFIKNTPLHDGAVIIKGDRVTAATCVLPVYKGELDKNLGTRHRAGMGIAVETDAMAVIVSEETGQISVAYQKQLYHGISLEELRRHLVELQGKNPNGVRDLLPARWRKDQNDG